MDPNQVDQRRIDGSFVKDISFTIPDHFLTFIEGEVKAGHFGSASDVVQAGLRLLEEQSAQLEQLRAALIEGEESGEPRPFDNDEFVARMRAKHAKSMATG
jgi:antitoxin ParD1/3/4